MAIADPVRQEILVMLRDEPETAGAIAKRFAISRPAISRHLRVLRECGLVHAEVAGRERVYSLDTAPLAELDQWLELFRDRWSQRLDALDTEVRRARRDRHRAETESRSSKPRPITQEGTA
jgi:DNA-binding transcriptional ArsR family regulator